MLRIAMISYHTCPLATLGGKDTGGMNVYVRELTRQLGHMGIHVDVFTRSQDDHVPHVLHELGYGNRVVHVPAGPEHPFRRRSLPVISRSLWKESRNLLPKRISGTT
jgi:D-inositol-3-phosphate glycosyltransferase